MKKTVTLLLCFIFLSSTSLFSQAQAAQYQQQADMLCAMGLFRGTNSGYELDREPTRIESLIMLIRMLGRENEARAFKGTYQFTDVPDWANEYVGYAYTNGLVMGISDIEFGSELPTTASQFITFVLRALQYSEANNEFSYFNAIEFSESIGLVEKGMYSEEYRFLRDDCVSIIINALNAKLNSTDQRLIDRLIFEGCVSYSAAANAGFVQKAVEYSSVPILMYHEVSYGKNDLYVSPESFEAQLDMMQNKGISTITIAQLYAHWEYGEPLPPKPLVLTFDDGYISMYETVYPMLSERNMVGTFFVVPNTRWSKTFLSEDMMREMSAAGLEIESHTMSHYELTGLSTEKMLYELAESRRVIEEVTGKPSQFICYPAGKNNYTVRNNAQKVGYLAGVTTQYGFAEKNQGYFSLKRIRISRGTTAEQLAKTLSPLGY